jgi:hypothetical protein
LARLRAVNGKRVFETPSQTEIKTIKSKQASKQASKLPPMMIASQNNKSIDPSTKTTIQR